MFVEAITIIVNLKLSFLSPLKHLSELLMIYQYNTGPIRFCDQGKSLEIIFFHLML